MQMTGYEVEVTLPKGHHKSLHMMVDGKYYKHGERFTTDAITARRLILLRRAIVAPGAIEPPPLPEPHSAAWRQ
jgi:hypothetical protein